MQRGAAFPPAGIVVVLRNLVEAELLIVIGADPLGRIDRALLERGINVTAGNLLWDETELLQCLAGPASDPHLEAFEVVDRLDLLAEPATHLTTGIAAHHARQIVLLGELIHQLEAIAIVVPRVLLAGVETEWKGAEQRPNRVLAEIIIGCSVTGLDGAVRGGVENLQARNDLAGSKNLDLELIVGRFSDVFSKRVAGPVNRIQRLRPACCETPFHFGRRLGNRGSCNGCSGGTKPSGL